MHSSPSTTDRSWTGATGASVNRGFTNRLTYEEEIEMSVHTTTSSLPATPSTGRDEKFAVIDEAEPSPTGSSLRTQQEDVDFRQIGAAADSTTELTPKMDQGEWEGKTRGI